jgi:hypothetical protein
MLTEEDKAQMDHEHDISDKIVKYLRLKPLYYSYHCDEDDKRIFGEGRISICLSEFFEGLTDEASIYVALRKTAIDGPCVFQWRSPLMDCTGEIKRAEFDSPTWSEVFRAANQAYIDGRSPDHAFLEGIHYEKRSGAYEFSFGS